MRTYPDPLDPSKQIPYYDRSEIERITWDELRLTKLASEDPAPVCMETFIMERYGLGIDYIELPEGTHGEAVFSAKGLQAIRLNRVFGENPTRGIYLLGRSTQAHECGHGIFHTAFIVPEMQQRARESTDELPLFRRRCGAGQIDDSPGSFCERRFTLNRALEWQANYAMGCLLMPSVPVFAALGTTDQSTIPDAIRRDGLEEWVSLLSATFDTSRPLTLYRILALFPALGDVAQETQLRRT
jgi:hypothetical protein